MKWISQGSLLPLLAASVMVCLSFPDDTPAAPAMENKVTVLEKEGTVEAARAGAATWEVAYTNQILRLADRIRTGERSRATLHLLDQSTMRVFELSEFLIEPLPAAPGKSRFSLSKGLLYLFHRDKPVDVQIKTRTATAAVRGTEFHLAVEENGRTVLTMFDGEVELANALGVVQLRNGEQGVVDPGQAPVKTPVINAINIIQWCLYYPGVLDLEELSLPEEARIALGESLTAYRAGDLLAALAQYPAGRQPLSDSEKVYLAALLLAVGRVTQSQALLETVNAVAESPLRRLVDSIRRVVAAVKLEIRSTAADVQPPAVLATEWLAHSYVEQARARLPEALLAARAAIARSPDFAFGWARVAELEFSFGHTKEARVALEKSLRLAPRNAQAVSLQGFLLAAQNRIREAQAEFGRAIALDGALGNAWLGRGLCRIRRGDVAGGREDLQVAATLEPQRALLRAYLAKAWSEDGDLSRAEDEIRLAKERDSADPTAYLYGALLLQQDNRINEGIEELERAQELNDNRRVYRSRLLLDQDRAVRGANLANFYRDAGMTDWSVREAGKALDADYANASAHQFLADSYTALRDPRQVNLRYETPAIAEQLLANLLSPVGASPLARTISQQEYSPLFERNRLGLATDVQYLSSGAWTVSGVQHGVLGNFGYAVEAFYQHDPGDRPNQDFEERTLDLRFKYQITPQDSLFVGATDSIRRAGDVSPYYDAADANPTLRMKDEIQPTVLAGWHREWSPESHTLLLAAYLHSDLTVHDPGGNFGSIAVQTNGAPIVAMVPIHFTLDYEGKLDIFSVEAQQILERDRHTTVFGALYQNGEFDTRSAEDMPDAFESLFSELPIVQEFTTPFERGKAYAYHHWQILHPLRISGGLTYDWLRYPANHRSVPISDSEETSSYLSPKLGLVWMPLPRVALRAAQSWSVSGTSFDQSFQLEPTEVAGFNQSFRSIIPEAIAGANAGARFIISGISLEKQLASKTYAAVSAERLASKLVRDIGAYETDLNTPGQAFEAADLTERLDYKEDSLGLSLHQLVGEEWAFTATYRVSRTKLHQYFTDVAPDAFVEAPLQSRTDAEAVLHRLLLRVGYNHPSGLFALTEAQLWSQDNRRDADVLADENFWQLNLLAGWRWWRRRAEVSVGLLNVTAQDYRLNPLSFTTEPQRERTFLARLRLSF